MIIATLLLLVGILAVLAIIAANGCFVAQEFAYMSVDRSRLRALAEAGDGAAQRALRVTRRMSFMLSGAQLGITVTGVLVGYVAEPLAKALSRSTLVYLTVFGWLIAVFDMAANGLLKLLRIEPVHDVEAHATPEELSLLIDRVIEFPQQDVAHAMVPRSRVDVVAADATIAEVRRTMAEGHTRYPVVDVEGMPLPDALDQLARERHQLACVVDECGGFAGILTNEDLAEELVGELTDEHDAAPQEEAVPIGDDAWLMDGDVHLDEVRRAVGHELPDTDVETLAGLVIEARGALPEVGERVEIELPADPTEIVEADRDRRAISVDVVAVENHVPSRLRVRVVHLSDETPEEER